jgi:outer membrane protein TolC
VKKFFIIVFSFGFLTINLDLLKAESLSQKDVAKYIIERSQKVKEINYKYLQMRLAPSLILSSYDWSLSGDLGQEWDKTESVTNPNSVLYQRYKSSLTLKKSLLTGTNLNFDYSRNSFYSDNNATTNTSIGQATGDLLGFSIEQNLWKNSFGQGDQSTVEASKLQFEANSMIRTNELQDLVLDALRLYWNTYVAEENFNEANAARERYKKFIDAVKKKTAYGYSNPGEIYQVQAEYENREQFVKISSSEYLKLRENLLQLLQLPVDQNISFPTMTAIPDAPKLTSKNLEDLRILKSQDLKIKSAEASLEASRSNQQPVLSLLGSVYTSGYSDTPSVAQSHLLSGSHPKYYVGIKFQYSFGSDYHTEDQINKKVGLDLEKTKRQRLNEELLNTHNQAERKVQTTYFAVLSSQKQKEYREKAMTALQRSFNQGRTDIGILIDAINRFFNSEIQYTRSIGDYFIALNEWAALRDELIPNQEDQ